MTSETVCKHREYLFPAVSTYYQEPLVLDHGEGMYLWDKHSLPRLNFPDHSRARRLDGP